MPYIDQKRRKELMTGAGASLESSGELNYMISLLINSILKRVGVSYYNINALIGALECAKLELYRRVAAPYEDTKREQNGDVYTVVSSGADDGDTKV